MSERVELARITRATYGMGGYQDVMLGISLTFSGKGWGTGFFDGWWAFPPDKSAQWTQEDADAAFAKTALLVSKTLKEAHKNDVAALVGTPVEVTFDGNTLKSWRVLTEVLPDE